MLADADRAIHGPHMGPLLDRIDLHLDEPSVPHQELAAEQGPRRESTDDAFDEGWAVESIEPTRFKVRPARTSDN